MRIVIAVLALASSTASAQVVYKCVGADGAIAYQSNRCDAGQVAKDAWSAVPDTMTRTEQVQRQRRQQQEDANSHYLRNLANRHRQSRGSAVVFASPNGPDSNCARAKAARDKAYDATRKMSLAAMERWADHVNNACGY